MVRALAVEVCYALPDQATVIEVEVPLGTTVREAIEKSGMRRRFPDLDLAKCRAGCFGRLLDWDDVLKPGERVEIYRPLPNDPKEMRRRAARGSR